MKKRTIKMEKIISEIYLKFSFFGFLIPILFFFIYNNSDYIKAAILGFLIPWIQIFANAIRIDFLISKSIKKENWRFGFFLMGLFTFGLWLLSIVMATIWWKAPGTFMLLWFLFIQKLAYYFWLKSKKRGR